MLCFAKCHRQSLISWQLCFTVFTIISSTNLCKSTTDGFGTSAFSVSSSSSLSPRKTLGQEIGSPSELAWQAWLLVENKSGGQSALDSANILRRITPKSIFIAPELISCPNGYTSDGKGVCKPTPIKIDEDAQRQFFLKRLNALYGKFGNNRKKPADATGPLQINIPISLAVKNNSLETQPVQPVLQQETLKIIEGVTENRLPISVEISQHSHTKVYNNNNQDLVSTVLYKVDNDTKVELKESAREEGTSFFLGSSNSSSSKTDTAQIGQVVPVAEIIEETNNTFSGIVDYKIPINIKTTFNTSDNESDQTKITTNRQQFHEHVDGQNSSDDSAPTVVLLLSPTKSPFTILTQTESESLKVGAFHQSLIDREFEQNENTTISSTEDETKFEMDTTIHTVAPLTTQTIVDSIDSTIKNNEKSYTQDTPEDEIVYTDEETQTEQESENHDNYDDTTHEIDQDDFGESEDELLKPGEAGMVISHKNRDIIRHKNHKQYISTIADVQDSTLTPAVDTTSIPTFPTINIQDSFDASDSTGKTDLIDYTKEDIISIQTTEIPSTIITSESSVEETTIFAPNQLISKDMIKIATRRIFTQSSVTKNRENHNKIDLKQLLESNREMTTDRKVIFATQGSHSITTSYGNKKSTNADKILETPYTFEEFEDANTKTERTPLSDFRHQNPLDQKQQKLSILNNNQSILFKNDGNIPSDFKDQMEESSKPSSMNFRRVSIQNNEDSFIRFPEQNFETLSQHRDYVRFPSDEVNSIHNQDSYKDHLLSPYHSRDEYSNILPTSTKSSIPTRQKSLSTHWRVPSTGVRVDRQHQQSQQQIRMGSNTSNYRQQKQKPMLLRFWARMPLIRDLSFYPTTNHGSHNEPIGGLDDSHRLNSMFSSAISQPTRRNNHYKEMSSHDVNRLLAQQLGQPAIGD